MNMNKEYLKELKEKYKKCCVACDKVKDKNKVSVNTCSACKVFSKQDMALLLDGYYQGYRNMGSGTKLKLSDAILCRIFELSDEGVTKYAIASTINKEFNNKSGQDAITWKQVHYVLTGKFTSPESIKRIESAREKVNRKKKK